jgi:putative flavoprotein involved in K+ transport
VWATGYKEDDSFVNIPYAKDSHGVITHYRGVTPAPGLFVLGRAWQWTRASSLLHGVGKDAAFITKVLKYYLEERYQQVNRVAGAACATC